MIEVEFYKIGILCPTCGYGIIHDADVSVNMFDYGFRTSRVETTLHMHCVYCGDRVLCSDYGDKLYHNFIGPEWDIMDIRTSDVHLVDL